MMSLADSLITPGTDFLGIAPQDSRHAFPRAGPVFSSPLPPAARPPLVPFNCIFKLVEDVAEGAVSATNRCLTGITQRQGIPFHARAESLASTSGQNGAPSSHHLCTRERGWCPLGESCTGEQLILAPRAE